MVKNNLISEFYELDVSQIMDKRIWDLPIIDEKEDIFHALSILGARNHVWVVKDKKTKELTGIITEHDVLSILAPKNLSSYGLGMQDISSIKYGTAKTAEDVMSNRVITCKPDDKVADALIIMMKYDLRRLPVVVDKKIVGEFTLNQLIRKYYDATQFIPIDEDETEGAK
jgi:predicted transcriptional regulator